MKRCIDFSVALIALLVLAPLMLAIALAVRLSDGGPLLFTQMRLGRGRRPYRIFKYRTMRAGWITPVGEWLRATGLDELPQLLNVLRGEMSLTGPRPLTAADVVRLGWDCELPRWRVRPGITGLAQLYAGRGARLSLFLDNCYVQKRGVSLDLAIVSVSAAMVLFGKKAVRGWLRRTIRSRHATVTDSGRHREDLRPAGAVPAFPGTGARLDANASIGRGHAARLS